MSAQCADIFYHLFTICFIKQFPHFQQPSIMRLDINLERMVIHRNILLQVSRGNISDAGLLVCGITNVVITGSLYFFCHINFSSVERGPLLYRYMG